MTERPILFSAPMVRALLDGSKTQTRRLVKWPDAPEWMDWDYEPNVVVEESDGRWWPWTNFRDGAGRADDTRLRCPYGGVGDRLWVRETAWYDRELIMVLGARRCFFEGGDVVFSDGRPGGKAPFADALTRESLDENDSLVKRPSIFMPRWASRITLEISDVRVQRLLDISEEDAIAEGVEPLHQGYFPYGISTWMTMVTNGREVPAQYSPTARQSFEMLWDFIHGKGAAEANPWVWAISFRRLNA